MAVILSLQVVADLSASIGNDLPKDAGILFARGPPTGSFPGPCLVVVASCKCSAGLEITGSLTSHARYHCDVLMERIKVASALGTKQDQLSPHRERYGKDPGTEDDVSSGRE